MRRVAAFVAVLAVMAVNSVALADFTEPAGYTGGNQDAAEVNAYGYSTVIITKASDDSDIVYVDQATGVFDDTMTFLLKQNPAIGKYTVRLGSKDGLPKQTYFYVGADSNNNNDLYMKRLQNEEPNGDPEDSETTWNIGYYVMVEADDYNSYNSLKVGYGDNSSNTYLGFPLNSGEYTEYDGEGDINLIFQLNNVPSAYKDSIAVYLSGNRVASSGQGGD